MYEDPDEVSSLLEMAAECVGRCMEPMAIVQRNLDEFLLSKVLKHAFPRKNTTALFMQTSTEKGRFSEDDITDLEENLENMRQVGFMLIADFTEEDKTLPKIRVTIEFAKQDITAVTCSKCNRPQGCIHVYVACLCRTIEYDDFPRDDMYRDAKIDLPLTDTLWPMDKDKLEKLLFKAMEKDTIHIIDLIQQCAGEDDIDDNENIHDPTVCCRTPDEIFSEMEVEEQFVASYNWKSLWKVKNHMKRAVKLCTVSPSSPLPLVYLTAVGRKVLDIAQTRLNKSSHTKLGEPCLLLHDLMVNGAYIFPQSQNAITIDDIDVDKWKVVVKNFKDHYESCLTHEYPTYILPCTAWVELPRIYPLYADKVKAVFGLDIKFGYLSEALASLFVPPPTPELDELVKGVVIPLESQYDEPLAVMMVRANAYKCTEPFDVSGEIRRPRRVKELKDFEHLCMLIDRTAERWGRFTLKNRAEEKGQVRLIDYILIKLAKIGLQYSILSVVGQHINIENEESIKDKHFLKFIIEQSKGITLTKQHSESTSKPKDENGNVEGDDHKGEDMISVNPTNKLEIGPVYPTYNVTESYVSPDALAPGFGLTKGQLAYCLLYWLIRRCELTVMQGSSRYEHAEGKQMEDVITGIHFLALELSRYSITTKRKTIYSTELQLLWKMDTLVEELLFYKCLRFSNRSDTFEYQHWLYLSAWVHLGYQFYGDHLPFQLGNCVFHLGEKTNAFKSPVPEMLYFGIYDRREIDRIRVYVMCEFIMLEHKRLYRFSRKTVGPYPPLHDINAPIPTRLPLVDAYGALLSVYFRYKGLEDGPGRLMYCKVEKVIQNCFTTSIKIIPHTLWRAMKNRLYFPSVYKELRKESNFIRDATYEDNFMLRISLHLCDMYHKQTSGEINMTVEKYCQTVVSSCRTLGAGPLFDDIPKMFQDLGKPWDHFITYVHMECILRYLTGPLWGNFRPSFNVYVLDVLRLRLKNPDLEKQYVNIKMWKYILRFKGPVTKLFRFYTDAICTDLIELFNQNLRKFEEGLDQYDLVLRTITLLACHKECEKCEGLLFPVLEDEDAEFTAQQIITIVEQVLTCTPSVHAQTTGLYIFLQRFNLQEESDGLSAHVYNDTLLTWLLENTKFKIRCIVDDRTRSADNIAACIIEEFELFMDNIKMDKNSKKNKFLAMVDTIPKEDWSTETTVKWTESVTPVLKLWLK